MFDEPTGHADTSLGAAFRDAGFLPPAERLAEIARQAVLDHPGDADAQGEAVLDAIEGDRVLLRAAWRRCTDDIGALLTVARNETGVAPAGTVGFVKPGSALSPPRGADPRPAAPAGGAGHGSYETQSVPARPANRPRVSPAATIAARNATSDAVFARRLSDRAVLGDLTLRELRRRARSAHDGVLCTLLLRKVAHAPEEVPLRDWCAPELVAAALREADAQIALL